MKLVKFLILLVVAAAVAGYFLGWYEISKSGEDSVNIKVNKDKVEKDVGSAVEKIKDLGAGRKEVTGKIKGVNPLAGTLDLTTADGETMSFKLDQATLEGGAADLAAITALIAGQSVVVKFEEKDGAKRILKVTKAS